MKTLIFFSAVLALSFNAQASPEYIENGRFQLALEDHFGSSTVGVGGKSNSCLLCHSSAAGGPGNINPSFGAAFEEAAQRTVGTDGDQLQATGPSSLATVIADATFLAEDSDGDGTSNEDEFLADTDPASDISGESGGSGSGGGGCGMIAPTQNNKTGFPPALLAILPLMALVFFRRKDLAKSSIS